MNKVDGSLLIADQNNNRVLVFNPPTSTLASRVIGQLTFTSNLPNMGNDLPSASSLWQPWSADWSQDGQSAFIADYGNHRGLLVPLQSLQATRVYGQSGQFNTRVSGANNVSATSLNGPAMVFQVRTHTKKFKFKMMGQGGGGNYVTNFFFSFL